MPYLDINRVRPTQPIEETLCLPLSKSLVARQMILASALDSELSLEGVRLDTLPEDIAYLRDALKALQVDAAEVCVGESGTAMRLMTALMACKVERPTKLYGLGRQHERPIAPLVESLRELGADISYIGQEGYPPLLIGPAQLQAGAVTLDASASSQYLSALMLIAPCLEGKGNYSIDVSASGLVSAPYAMMTMNYMQSLTLEWSVQGEVFHYLGTKELEAGQGLKVESDWTAASYAYQHLALLPKGSSLYLPNLRLPSLQGDSLALPRIYESFGIRTDVENDGVRLRRVSEDVSVEPLHEYCDSTPDIVPTLIASCVVSGRPFRLEGVAHLRIKESDRLEAVQTECAKVGVAIELGEDSASWDGVGLLMDIDTAEPIILNEYGDHRIAMAMAPMLIEKHTQGARLYHSEVVGKSYPHYWQELARLAYTFQSYE